MQRDSYKTIALPIAVPLHYDTVYYVESRDNEALNRAMLQLQQAGSLFYNREVLPFPIKLQYVSQKELNDDYLRSQLSAIYNAEDVDDAISELRESLSADKGGCLTARYMPNFTDDDVIEDDYDICSLSEFSNCSPDNAPENAKSFAHFVAMENFKRLSGESYYTFQQAKEKARRPQRSHSGSGYSMNFIVRLPDPNKITSDMQRRISKLSDTIEQLSEDNDAFAGELLAAYLMMKQNKGKLKKVYPIFVRDDKIYLKISENEHKKVVFGRYGVANTLYIFFLRLIERAAKDNCDPIYVSKVGLEKYKEELLSIYKYISGYASGMSDIESWWEKSSNDFANALSSIRKFFKREFDVDAIEKQYNKCYTIEKMGKDEEFNNETYGIKLSTEDFDLGDYSIKRTRF